jgi:hypothetical protein
MRVIWIGLMAALALQAQNPLARTDSFVGTFQGEGVTLQLGGSGGTYTGSLTFAGYKMPARVKASGGNATGEFDVNGQTPQTYGFTMVAEGNGFRLTSEGKEYRIVRQGEAAAPAPAASGGSIVGTWRGAQGTARFRADGTGMMDGVEGRYSIKGDQLTLMRESAQITLGFEVRGDVLTLLGGKGAVTLNRVKEESGPGSVHQELVGKWCWISQTNVNQGARQSSRCLTLSGDGTYAYTGLTDSYAPNGGATGESSDSGTWTATETTITAHSASGKVTTYQLEKRNHPKNVRDPMIVLDGQAFVTYYNKPPW